MSVLTSCGVALLLLAPYLYGQRVRGGFGSREEGPRAHAHRNALDRWNQMTPEQRQRALAKLPPERRKRIQNRIEEFNRLPKEQQQQLRERYHQFLQLPPEKQDLVRKEIRQFNQLPDERRQTLTKEFEQLRGMPDAERKSRLDSEDYKNKFSPEERQILQDLSGSLSIPEK